jgi:hypothetical protein
MISIAEGQPAMTAKRQIQSEGAAKRKIGMNFPNTAVPIGSDKMDPVSRERVGWMPWPLESAVPIHNMTAQWKRSKATMVRNGFLRPNPTERPT